MKEFYRKHKEDKPVVAICYDFDKTLSPDDMQAQGYIQSVGYEVDTFWRESNGLAENNDMDQNLAYMYKMMQEAEGNFVFNREKLEEYGSKVSLFPGVEEWFERIKSFGVEHGVIVEHYIISSGLKEMIDGTSVAKNGAFEKVYASSFYYNSRNVAVWPAQVVNYTNKTQFLFRIEKGILDVNDPAVNDYYPPDEIRVPFRNIIYIGDSATDIPCMKLVNSYGGHSIGVYNPSTMDKSKVYKMMLDNRIRYFSSANYMEGSELDCIIKKIIVRTEANESLENLYISCRKEADEDDKSKTREGKIKMNLILQLENSYSFANTHAVVRELQLIDNWTNDEMERLFDCAMYNLQVHYILSDYDVRQFYKSVLSKIKTKSEKALEVERIIMEKEGQDDLL